MGLGGTPQPLFRAALCVLCTLVLAVQPAQGTACPQHALKAVNPEALGVHQFSLIGEAGVQPGHRWAVSGFTQCHTNTRQIPVLLSVIQT